MVDHCNSPVACEWSKRCTAHHWSHTCMSFVCMSFTCTSLHYMILHYERVTGPSDSSRLLKTPREWLPASSITRSSITLSSILLDLPFLYPQHSLQHSLSSINTRVRVIRMTKFTWGDIKRFIFEIKKLKVKFTAQVNLLVVTAQKHGESHSNYQDYIIETCFPLPKSFRKSLRGSSARCHRVQDIAQASWARNSERSCE